MKKAFFARRWMVLAAWLLAAVICIVLIARATFTTDLSAFLPQTPTKEQQVLLDQLRDGVVSRLILVGIEGSDEATRAALSKEVAKRLRDESAFAAVNNGEPVNARRDQAYFFGNRYLLSPAVDAERFSVAGLRSAISETIDSLASPAGMLIKPLLPRDPTAEIVQLLDQVNSGNQPPSRHGAWTSADGARSLMLLQTHAAGADIDAQQQAMALVQNAFDAARRQQGNAAAEAQVVMTGPGVFAVQSRDTIKSEVTRLSVISVLVIVTLLLLVYRSLTALALGLLPVVSGALVAVVAVSLGFGTVHGITLGFGTTLIGEAIDYSIYLFIQSRQPGTGAVRVSDEWIAKFWPTIRLGVMTSIVGFSCLLLSSFPGLAQLGLYSIAGLVTAALVTRFVLPELLPTDFRIRDVSAIGARFCTIARGVTMLRWPLLLVVLAAVVVVVQQRDSLWNAELSSLSPVSAADQAIDARLRADMGAPDVRYMVVVSGASSEEVLQSAEKVAEQLQPLIAQGVLAGFETPSRYLPSIATQQRRQASLPTGDLAARLYRATIGLPVRAQLFTPFIKDVAAAKSRAPLQRADLDNTSLALVVDSLLYQRGTEWRAILPLSAPAAGTSAHSIATEPVRAALVAAGEPHAVFVDLKAESDNLYTGYLQEAVMLSLGGVAGIIVLLLFSLRSPARVLRVLVPLAAAVISVVAILVLSGQRLTILHLVGLLLIVAVGSNYALFFNPQRSQKIAGSQDEASREAGAGVTPQTLTSLVFANLTTVAAFGLLGFANVPVLQAIGTTVGPGAVLALLYAAAFADKKLIGATASNIASSSAAPAATSAR